MTDKIIVLTTCDTAKEAAKLARHLVDLRVAACVNILPKGRSVYRWNGKLEEAAEQLLMIKTRRDLFSSLRTEIEKLHSYEVPEIIAIPVVEGSDAYLGWIDQELTAPGSE